mmetsp:Transcript_32413/g.28702  ORF Transcript_32413/g.28702 Transcript_32413/m.28702 type:complete len:173 (+) Transcript_32413:393-911(+)
MKPGEFSGSTQKEAQESKLGTQVKSSDGTEFEEEKISTTKRKIKSMRNNTLKLTLNVETTTPSIKITNSKIKKYSGRLDVVRKTIFRQLKRFYTTLWKLESYKTTNNSELIFDQANKFVLKHFQTSQNLYFSKQEDSKLDLFIVALIDNKKKYSNADSSYNEIRNKISSMMS